jgi:general secretion pathway protein A
LTGQNELRDILNRRELRQLKQRIAIRLVVHPLSEREVEPYLRHRWTRAGGSDPIPFSADAIKEIVACSGGIPRLINVICDNALMLAYASGTRTIDHPQIHAVSTELDLFENEGDETIAARTEMAPIADSDDSQMPVAAPQAAPPSSDAKASKPAAKRKLSFLKRVATNLGID